MNNIYFKEGWLAYLFSFTSREKIVVILVWGEENNGFDLLGSCHLS